MYSHGACLPVSGCSEDRAGRPSSGRGEIHVSAGAEQAGGPSLVNSFFTAIVAHY